MSRVQLALNVSDIDEAIAFYRKLFGTEPAKVRPGYANFAIAQPPLKLVLLENPGHADRLNHLGIEVSDATAVNAEQRRLTDAGLASVDERGKSTPSWLTARPSPAAAVVSLPDAVECPRT
jgi:catechol 2,3-dioxygenase-like lactoylglutathione lyase family enzyme